MSMNSEAMDRFATGEVAVMMPEGVEVVVHGYGRDGRGMFASVTRVGMSNGAMMQCLPYSLLPLSSREGLCACQVVGCHHNADCSASMVACPSVLAERDRGYTTCSGCRSEATGKKMAEEGDDR